MPWPQGHPFALVPMGHEDHHILVKDVPSHQAGDGVKVDGEAWDLGASPDPMAERPSSPRLLDASVPSRPSWTIRHGPPGSLPASMPWYCGDQGRPGTNSFYRKRTTWSPGGMRRLGPKFSIATRCIRDMETLANRDHAACMTLATSRPRARGQRGISLSKGPGRSMR